MTSSDGRYYYFDFLRVAAAFAVMVLHVAWRELYTPPYPPQWEIINFWHGSIVRWAVPAFVMISGALFLSRDIPVRKIYGKYIFRILTAFLFWSFFYACGSYAKNRSAVSALCHFVGGHYHLWFLYMIAGLYMLVPFVKKIAESETLTKYFLVLSFLFALLLPEAAKLISVFSDEYGEIAVNIVSYFNLQFVGGYTGYFLLGYFLNKADISRRAAGVIYALGTFGFTAGVFLSVYVSDIAGEPDSNFYRELTANSALVSAAVFVFFKSKLNRPSRIIRELSRYSFGAYLVHDAVITLVGKFGLSAQSFTPLISVPVTAAAVFVISFGISAVLNHIPVIRKYTV